VEARDVVKTFPNPEGGTVVAVDHVSLRIMDGEFFSLLGPSGCGKSTLLRMVAGLERPTAGEILLDGRVMGDTPPYLRPVNMVFQSFALFPHLTVFQNVAFGLEMAGRPRDEIRARVAEALAMVRLPDVGARKPAQLSGGQQQRIAVARALVNRPDVLLLDEPLGALDLKLRKEMQAELKALQQRVGITFVHVTHDQEEALAMSNRIAVMHEGRILQVGAPAVIYERPSCRFVADFIGETNFLEGEVVSLDGGGLGTLRVDGEGCVLTGLIGEGLAVGRRATYSVRPEKIQARTAAPVPEIANRLPARVEEITYIGSDTRLRVRVSPNLALAVWEPNAISTLDPEEYYTPGEAVWLSWRPQNALLLGN